MKKLFAGLIVLCAVASIFGVLLTPAPAYAISEITTILCAEWAGCPHCPGAAILCIIASQYDDWIDDIMGHDW